MSEWILPAASTADAPSRTGHARASMGPAVKNVISPSASAPARRAASAMAGYRTAQRLLSMVCGCRRTATATTDKLQEVVVTGSLIPQTEKETAQPLTVITPDDIQKKGFASVAEALQLSLYAVVLVKANALPRTGMGKIQRYLVRKQFLQAQEIPQTV